ncbi:hypothetical protein GCM10010507_44610 [Streptomyces cinnamoneus]|uniref:Uncharacterized protein n=1 Tax=Streptomyces cinnamoneus TaxID=53446 RepID=A0A918TUJ2_STRCJ|nr:hypothetical protein GCM10010507_44610 [Streptomyces cinnamoneus]
MALVRLRLTEVGRTFLRGYELLLHPHLAAQKVDVLDLQPEHLALAQPGRCGKQGEGPIPGRSRVDQSADEVRVQRHDLGTALRRQPHPVARVHGDDPVTHGRVQHAHEVRVRHPERGQGEHLCTVLDHACISDGRMLATGRSPNVG